MTRRVLGPLPEPLPLAEEFATLRPGATKRCGRCATIRPLDEFDKAQSGRVYRYRSTCKPCGLELQNARPRQENRIPREICSDCGGSLEGRDVFYARCSPCDAVYRRARHDEREEQKRAGRPDHCEICGGQETSQRGGRQRRLAIDHNHETGEYRGMLCGRCNSAIGLLGDDPERIRAAAAYLESRGHATPVSTQKVGLTS